MKLVEEQGIVDPKLMKEAVLKIMSFYAFKHEHGYDFTMPGHNWAGPGTNVVDNLRNNLKPTNALDHAAFHHDISYTLANNVSDIHTADSQMLEEINSNMINGLFKTKTALGFDSSFLSTLSDNEKLLVGTLAKLQEHEWYGDKIDAAQINSVIKKLKPKFETS